MNKNSLNQIEKAILVLKSGGVIAYPTDTVCGIGCDVFNQKAVARLFKIKGRGFDKPLSIACSNIQMIREIANISKTDEQIISNFLPGPYTFLLKKKKNISDLITAGNELVGVRIPDDQIILEIINKFGRPIITTSANISGYDDVFECDKITLNVDFKVLGDCKHKRSSTVYDLVNKKILRSGVGVGKLKEYFSN